MYCSTPSGGLDDFVRSQAASADAQAANTAVHHRPDTLKVGLEPAWRHVVRVADVPADDGAFSADLAAFCHVAVPGGRSPGVLVEQPRSSGRDPAPDGGDFELMALGAALKPRHKHQIIAYPGMIRPLPGSRAVGPACCDSEPSAPAFAPLATMIRESSDRKTGCS